MINKIAYLILLLLITTSQADIVEVSSSGGSGVYADNSGNIFIYDLNIAAVIMIESSYTCSSAASNCQENVILDANGDGMGNFLDRPSSVIADSNGNIYVSGQFSDNVFRVLNPLNCMTDCIREVVNSNGSGASGLENPVALTVDTNDNIYVAGASSNNVIKIGASNTCATDGTPCNLVEIIDFDGDDGMGPNELNQPVGLASDSQGNVFVTTQNSDNVYKIATPGSCNTSGSCTITELVDENTIGDRAFGRGIVVDSQDNVLFTSLGFSLPASVFKIDTPGTCSTGGTPCTITEIFNMDTPQQAGNMTLDDADNIYFAGGNGDNALKIDTPNGCSTNIVGTPCTITEIIDSTGDGTAILDGTSDVAFAFGSIYVSGGISDNVFRVNDVAVSNDLIFYNGFD